MAYWSRSFEGRAEILSEVRQFTAAVLGDRPGVDLVVLAASELAGNAVLHTASGKPGGQFAVHVATFSDRWKVRVDDEGGPAEPVIATVSDDEEPQESGRGLLLVAAISESWGVLGDHYARAVWAEIMRPQDSGVNARSGVLTGSELKALEAILDAMAEEKAETAEPPVLELQSSDTPPRRPPDPDEASPESAPATEDHRERRPPEWHERPDRTRLLAAGVTELEAMLIEMAYDETMGRV